MKRLILILAAILVFLCVLLVFYTAFGSHRAKASWLASYPGLCPEKQLTFIPLPIPFLGSYLLKCELFPETMDYANPLVLVNIRTCTAVLYLPNLSLPGEYLGKFSSTTQMPVCP